MQKQDLIDAVFEATKLPKWQVDDVVSAFVEQITNALARDEQVLIVGFGSFFVKHIKARKGRNPKTGEPIDIPASNKMVFKASRVLRRNVNQ